MSYLLLKMTIKYILHFLKSLAVLSPGKSHGQRSLVGHSPWGLEESDTTERLHFHFSLSCIGEGNDNPLQCSCLENPRDGGAWWAAVYGVAQSRTWLKRLSSSSSSSSIPSLWFIDQFTIWKKFTYSNLDIILIHWCQWNSKYLGQPLEYGK